jgi:hypothetical protein
MDLKRQRAYADGIRKQMKQAKNIIVEKPGEVASMLGLEMWEFEVLSGEESGTNEAAWCADEEISISFQGKEMRIYINEDGKLCVYTD